MKDIAICFEGINDKDFLQLFLKRLGLDENRVEFFRMGGKSNFFKPAKYQELKHNIEAEMINKVLFMLDVDNEKTDAKFNGLQNTQTEIDKTIAELGFKNVNVETCLIYDPETKDGYLESLILSTIPGEHKKCVNDFLDCSKFKDKTSQKAILHQIYKTAYPSCAYDFSHSNFSDLKTKLTNLF
ncbi:hypothetical protein SPONL_669 [uncultured Candidatus Thioglobus sp.]|nr:hypothetical protein SPONL_669 [uncultured Candidatus Thioglobus sp.]